MKRLKYRLNNGMMVTKPMLMNGSLVTVEINPSTYQFTVKQDDNTVLHQGVGTSMLNTQKLAKSWLIANGVVFETELRNRITLQSA